MDAVFVDMTRKESGFMASSTHSIAQLGCNVKASSAAARLRIQTAFSKRRAPAGHLASRLAGAIAGAEDSDILRDVPGVHQWWESTKTKEPRNPNNSPKSIIATRQTSSPARDQSPARVSTVALDDHDDDDNNHDVPGEYWHPRDLFWVTLLF